MCVFEYVCKLWSLFFIYFSCVCSVCNVCVCPLRLCVKTLSVQDATASM